MADLGEVVGDKTWNALFRQCRESFVAMEECRQRSGLGDSQDVERTEKACPRETEALRGCLQEKGTLLGDRCVSAFGALELCVKDNASNPGAKCQEHVKALLHCIDSFGEE